MSVYEILIDLKSHTYFSLETKFWKIGLPSKPTYLSLTTMDLLERIVCKSIEKLERHIYYLVHSKKLDNKENLALNAL